MSTQPPGRSGSALPASPALLKGVTCPLITTVVGNYPKIGGKGPSVRASIARFDVGRLTAEELAQVADQATAEVLEEQARAGIDLVTDGQIRWDDGQTYFAQGIQGFALSGLLRYFDTNTYYRQLVATGPLRWKEPICVRDFEFARANSARPVKPVVTGPYTLGLLSANQHYPHLRDMVLDLALALNEEARALEGAGATIIQFDEPLITSPKGRDFPLFQEASRIVTRGLTARTAVYAHFGDIRGLYPDFLKLPFDVIGLDFVMGAANFDILRQFPSDKELGFGILDARNTRLETVEQISDVLDRISRLVPLERVQVSPSCGLEFLPRPTAYAKLARLVEGVKSAEGVRA